MAQAVRLDPRVSRRACAGALSVALHVAALIVLLAGGSRDGLNPAEAPVSLLYLPEARQPDRNEVVEQPPLAPADPALAAEDQLQAAIAKLTLRPADVVFPGPAEYALPDEPQTEALEPSSISLYRTVATVAMSDAERAALSKRLERLAEESRNVSRAEVSWQQDGRQFNAVLIREPANDATTLERVVAQVSTSDRGRYLTTVVNLRRLAFSQFTQIVDFWDPSVQLHDDEIVGRFHSNSRLNLLYDSSGGPKFLGKVTTAARSFNTEVLSRRRDAEIFRGGKETRAARIELPESPQPFAWAPMEENARIHEFANDTNITFFADGSYAWRTRRSSEPEQRHEPSGHPVYFVAASNVELYVEGVVAGRVLIYSPHRIVIAGSLTYASDPREDPESGDYVGLVSNKYVEVAPPSMTGPGDLEIDAAIFAGRRFSVTNIDHPRKATLRIYGSLAAGSLTATEPRYATRIEYDSRFERQRPPGFPSTDRYEAVDWEGSWMEAPN